MSNKKSVKINGIYRNKIFNSMLPKKVIGVHNGIVTVEEKKYMSNANVTYPEKQFLKDNYLVS